MSEPTPGSDDAIATHHFTNPAGQLTDVWQPAVDDALTTPTDLVRPGWRYGYDADGNQTSQTDPRGKLTSFAYDERGLRVSRTLPSDGNPATSDTETWTYDTRGRVDVHADFKGQSTKHVYETDARYGGRLKEQQRFTGVVDATPDETTVYAFDPLGRRTAATEAARVETTAYDSITGAAAMTASPEGVVRHAYDPATGRLTATWTAPNPTSVVDLATARTSAHTLTEYEYNYLGQLWKVKAVRLNGGTVPTAQQTTTYTYDAAGNQSTLSLPNGVTTTYAYDALNRLDTLTAKRGATTVFSQDYDLRGDGQRSGVSETREGGSTVQINWTYDALNRLTGETYNSSDNTKDYAATFTFDLAGNRAKKVQTGAFQPATTTYAYNDRDQLTSEMTGSTTTAYTYDANGSMTVKGADSHAWDLRNRMKSAAAAGVATTYVYDAAGQRVSQQTGAAVATNYVNDKANPTGYPQIIEEKAGATPGRSYVVGRAVLGQSSGPGAVTYFLRDGHGSNRGLINALGVVAASLDYQAFGEAIGFDPKLAGTVHLFGGDAEFDPTSSFYFHDKRWRQTHQFISHDDYEAASNLPAFLHKYLYAGANPVAHVDPSGNSFTGQLVTVGLVGVMVGVILKGSEMVGRSYMESRTASRTAAGVGGPDITAQLNALNAHFKTLGASGTLPDPNLFWDNWDVYELRNWGSTGYGDTHRGEPGVLADDTGYFKSVTVARKVYRPDEVNYYLWGIWMRETNSSLALAQWKVFSHGAMNRGGARVAERLLWMRAGFEDNLSVAEPTAIRGASPGAPSTDRLGFMIHNGTPSGLILPNGTVVPGSGVVVNE